MSRGSYFFFFQKQLINDQCYRPQDILFITLDDKFDKTLKKRKEIVEIFMKKVYGKKANTKSSNQKHSGKKGHWLEKQMGTKPNGRNNPDLKGYEMKTETSPITVGSWDPNYWIFRDEGQFPELIGKKGKDKTAQRKINQNQFLEYFGKPNEDKENRLSWSGTPIPKIDQTNLFGMKAEISNDDSYQIFYSFSKDSREGIESKIPERFQKGKTLIAKWGTSEEKSVRAKWNGGRKVSFKEKWNNKWDENGWFICRMDKDGKYNSIVFGRPQKFKFFIDHLKTGEIYFDSGMYYGNSRNYCQWRTPKAFFDNLIVETYDAHIKTLDVRLNGNSISTIDITETSQ